MKKLFLAAFAVFAFSNIQAQGTSFGVTAGLSNLNVQASLGGDEDDESETGFHIGLLADLGISEKFHVQPELTFSNGGDVSFINLNVLAKFYVSDGLNLQAGPTIGTAGGDDIDAVEALLGDDFTKLNLGLAVGAGYDISESFFAQARYGFQINDHFKGSGNGEIKINNFLVGVGYKF
ncbi:MAG: porin family protein [Winogradskyella sp.]|uniref:outer membrane beta-barrel protein n=1 Tax=Winogradskyella sp. TaxID=1883156 RepID=UPI00182075C0|nr:porin family protein [Winogradskyella sp.]